MNENIQSSFFCPVWNKYFVIIGSLILFRFLWFLLAIDLENCFPLALFSRRICSWDLSLQFRVFDYWPSPATWTRRTLISDPASNMQISWRRTKSSSDPPLTLPCRWATEAAEGKMRALSGQQNCSSSKAVSVRSATNQRQRKKNEASSETKKNVIF